MRGGNPEPDRILIWFPTVPMELNHVSIPMDVLADERRRKKRTMPTAIIQCADTGPLESLVYMLESVGYECFTPSTMILDHLRRIGCDTVLSIQHLVDNMGYEPPKRMPEASISMMDKCDLFVDIKAHRSYHKIVDAWPNLIGKILWYRINGGNPEHVINSRGDHGDEINPPCPVLSPNQWYNRGTIEVTPRDQPIHHVRTFKKSPNSCGCWPPFVRFSSYYAEHGRAEHKSLPICLIHNAAGWGYERLFAPLGNLGIQIYGVSSPDGLLQHSVIPSLLSTTKAYVHLKSSDAPGYALYEALSAACPIICSRRLIWRCRMHELLIPNETCLVFDRETHEGLSDQDVADCTAEIKSHLDRLQNPAENARIGLAGMNRLKEVMWSASRPDDHTSLKNFMALNFPK